MKGKQSEKKPLDIVEVKKESIDKNPRLPKGRFKPDPKRINREKPMSKKGHSLSFRLCVAALFFTIPVSNLHCE